MELFAQIPRDLRMLNRSKLSLCIPVAGFPALSRRPAFSKGLIAHREFLTEKDSPYEEITQTIAEAHGPNIKREDVFDIIGSQCLL